MYFCPFLDFMMNSCTLKTNQNSFVKKFILWQILSFLVLFILNLNAAKATHSHFAVDTTSTQNKTIKNAQVQIKIKLEQTELSFEITRGTIKYKVTAVNEIGKISFTNSKSVLSYLGNEFTRVDYILHKSDFLLFPVQDQAGRLVFYRVSLNLENGSSTSALPYLTMKNQSALFNQKMVKMLIYEQIKQENTRTKKLYYITNFNIYHLDKSEKENYREFYSTEKFVGVPSNLSPQALKIRMMDLLIDFMPNSTIEHYFR